MQKVCQREIGHRRLIFADNRWFLGVSGVRVCQLVTARRENVTEEGWPVGFEGA